jgi:serine/threonine-protein kinase HipA
MQLSGVQPKLPVHLKDNYGSLEVSLGGNTLTTTHILKLPSPIYPELVENEWASMELATRVGLSVAPVRRVRFQQGSALGGPGLLIERFDIPVTLEGRGRLLLLEDGASLLGLPRIDKYRTSFERVANALQDSGLGTDGMQQFLDHVAFGWIMGNGDLHAKNLSVLWEIEADRFGRAPSVAGVRYSPLYDLVNTRVVLPGDHFALPLNGKNYNLRLNDFVRLGERCGLERNVTRERVSAIGERIVEVVEDVLEASGLSEESREAYRGVVATNVRGL